MSHFTVTIYCTIREDDVVTNDIETMAAVCEFAADQIERFFPHLDVVTEGSVTS